MKCELCLHIHLRFSPTPCEKHITLMHFFLFFLPFFLHQSKLVCIKGVVQSTFLQRVRTLGSLRDTLLFTGTKTIQYFSKYEPSTSLEKPQLPTDVTTITDARIICFVVIKTMQQFSHCVSMRRIPIVNNMSSTHFLLTTIPTIIFLTPYYDVTGQKFEIRVI